MAASAMDTTPTSIFLRIFRRKPFVMFWRPFTVREWHIIVFSHPRDAPYSMSNAFSDALLGLFVAYDIYQ